MRSPAFAPAANTDPTIARLFDSVADEVKMISFGRPPMAAATCSRASSTAFHPR
jgi:hypothetical protein